MTTPETTGRFGLGATIMLLLALALLPFGVISVIQSLRLANDAVERADLSVIALTERAASNEQQVLERALGAAEALGAVIDPLRSTPERCFAYFQNYLAVAQRYSFIGFQDKEGIIECSSSEIRLDNSRDEGFRDLMRDPRPRFIVNRNPRVSGESVLVAASPVYVDRELEGYVFISIPHSRLATVEANETQRARPLGLVTFNRSGEILTAETKYDLAQEKLPKNTPLASLAAPEPAVFAGVSVGGERRKYVVIEVVPGTVYAMGIWDPDSPVFADVTTIAATTALTVLMWLASLIVAYFAVHRLIVRGLQRLKTQVAAFETNRRWPEGPSENHGELLDLEAAFRDMAETIVRDEAELEKSVHEKGVLLKEVHHRVKNNLQLITSMMNIQLRREISGETRAIVRRLQERVMALAAIHRSLYQADIEGTLDAGVMVREIVDQSMRMGASSGGDIALDTEIDSVILYPDQGVPLSMLVSEAMTNALKYTKGPSQRIAVRLSLHDHDTAEFELTNTVDGSGPQEPGTGVGSQLINAFVRQLDATVESGIDGDVYRLRVTFPVADFSPDADDEET